jgi:hypothetical protein
MAEDDLAVVADRDIAALVQLASKPCRTGRTGRSGLRTAPCAGRTARLAVRVARPCPARPGRLPPQRSCPQLDFRHRPAPAAPGGPAVFLPPAVAQKGCPRPAEPGPACIRERRAGAGSAWSSYLPSSRPAPGRFWPARSQPHPERFHVRHLCEPDRSGDQPALGLGNAQGLRLPGIDQGVGQGGVKLGQPLQQQCEGRVVVSVAAGPSRGPAAAALHDQRHPAALRLGRKGRIQGPACSVENLQAVIMVGFGF